MLSNPYLYLSLVALLAKIWCGHRLRANWVNSGTSYICFLFLLIQYAQTVLEIFVCYAVAYPGQDMVLLLKIYYALFTSSLICIPLVIHAVSNSRHNSIFTAVTLSLVAIITLLTLGTDLIIADAILMQYTMTRVAGPYYGIFQLLSFGSMFLALGIALVGYCYGKTEIKRVKSINFFAGYLPYVTFLFFVISLMAIGVKLNAAGLSPIIISIFLIILSENVRRNQVLDLRIYFFWTKKARRIREITHALRFVSQSPDHAKGTLEKYNSGLIETAEEIFSYLDHGRGKQKHMAAWLGLSESKMSRLKAKQSG